MSVLLSLLVGAVVALLGFVYISLTRHKNYWSKRGIPSKISPLWKELPAMFTHKKPFWEAFDDIYNDAKKHGVTGLLQLGVPTLLVTDPEIIKHVFTKDFSSFHDRPQFGDDNDVFSSNLFNLAGQKWKNLRAKLTPTFTSGKIKHMFNLILEVEDEFKELLRNKIKTEEELEMKDLLIRYTSDIIGTCAFGINCNSLKNPESEFYKMGRDTFRFSKLFLLSIVLSSVSKKLGKILPSKMFLGKVTDFFDNLMKETIEFRQKNNVERNDFVQLMMLLRETDKNQTDRENHIEFTHSVIAAQSMLFFIAGLDNVANTLGFALYELAKYPDIQAQAAKEVNDVLAKHEGKFTYEGVKDMDLIERIIMETMRKWCPIPVLSRKVTAQEYTIPKTKYTFDSLSTITIPVWQLHRDPEIYPDPERFDPDRFTPEAKSARHQYTYLPFGEGPRVCIAERFVMVELKLGLAGLLQEFEFSVCPRTDMKPEMDLTFFAPTPREGFWLKVKERIISN